MDVLNSLNSLRDQEFDWKYLFFVQNYQEVLPFVWGICRRKTD